MEIYRIEKSDRNIKGTIELTGSKSISNRALIIQALCKEPFEIKRLAAANDTDLLQDLLASEEEIRDAGPAGTTYRFMTAYLAFQPGTQVLTGTERMKKRPIGVLAEALKTLGAQIEYLGEEGYPPLKIGSAQYKGINQLTVSAGTSSQYISALLMIAPTLPDGLELTLDGKIVSRSYIEMTLNLMHYFGITYHWEGNTIKVAPQDYQAKPFTVEADWSAASYYYAMAAFADELDLQLKGLFADSVQGDAVLARIMQHFGVRTAYTTSGIHLTKHPSDPAIFAWDYILCPDIAQTMAVICGGLGRTSHFTGLETLSIKETDRIKALKQELAKVGVTFGALVGKDTAKDFFEVSGQAIVDNLPQFATYEDHRMAMAFAPLAMLGPIRMEEPRVVIKSYPHFWEDLSTLGFNVTTYP